MHTYFVSGPNTGQVPLWSFWPVKNHFRFWAVWIENVVAPCPYLSVHLHPTVCGLDAVNVICHTFWHEWLISAVYLCSFPHVPPGLDWAPQCRKLFFFFSCFHKPWNLISLPIKSFKLLLSYGSTFSAMVVVICS